MIRVIAAVGATSFYNQNAQTKTKYYQDKEVTKTKIKEDFKIKLDQEISKLSIDILV